MGNQVEHGCSKEELRESFGYGDDTKEQLVRMTAERKKWLPQNVDLGLKTLKVFVWCKWFYLVWCERILSPLSLLYHSLIYISIGNIFGNQNIWLWQEPHIWSIAYYGIDIFVSNLVTHVLKDCEQ